MNLRFAISIAIAFVALPLSACNPAEVENTPTAPLLTDNNQSVPTDPGGPAPKQQSSPVLPPEIVEGSNQAIAWEALMGPDGEYAASAAYMAVLAKYGEVEPYATIQGAEERHANALVRQLERYGISVPENPYLGTIEPPSDLEQAAKAWAGGEIANVAMYDSLISQATDSQLIRVLENLRRASLESHLPAFEAAAANGGTLDPGEIPHQ